MDRFITLLFALTCFATSWISSSIMGTGMWFWVIIASGCIVVLSPYFPKWYALGVIVAGLLGIMSVFAVLLGLLAATIGGSFRLANEEALLLGLFGLIAIFGCIIVLNNRRRIRRSREFNV